MPLSLCPSGSLFNSPWALWSRCSTRESVDAEDVDEEVDDEVDVIGSFLQCMKGGTLSNLKIQGGNAVEFKNIRFSSIDVKFYEIVFICNRNEVRNAAEKIKLDFVGVC